jgi:hypothetical protein
MRLRPPRVRNFTLLYLLIKEGRYAGVIDRLEWPLLEGL